ncbi:MAG: dynamin family protein [Oscillospiraceae bacterium]
MSTRKTDAIARQLESFSSLLGEIALRLSPFDDCADPVGFAQLRKDFQGQTEDFFSEHRKFNLAVLGQVKAGKSSFLNMLLFHGEPVLPRAATPKTSALTCIEYAPQNHLTVEYMTTAEWIGLRRLSASALETPQVRAARETIALAAERGTPVEHCLAVGREVLYFDNDADLNHQLENYVGESGLRTPMVKYVTLGLALDCLQNLSVIDTPGLNDPLSSRTERTRQFLSRCDAAFFLSRSSYFLDQNDLLLLTSQLPQKGVGRLTLIASQYDSALMDTLADAGSLEQADSETKLNLRRHAADSLDEAILRMRRSGGLPSILEVIESCREPVFVSVVAQKMAGKQPEDYTGVEKIVQRQLSLRAPVTAEALTEIGNFNAVRKIFDSLIEEKEKLLLRKAAAFVATAQSNLRAWLFALRGVQQARQSELERARLCLEQRQLQLAERINRFNNALSAAMDQYFEPLDGALTRAVFALNRMQAQWGDPPTRVELEVHTHAKTVSATRWNRPSTWGKRYQLYTSEETTNRVMDSDEARNSLTQFWAAASDLCAGAFSGLETPPLANALYRLAGEQFASDSTARQPQRLSALVAHALSLLEVHLAAPTRNPQGFLPAQFSGPVRDPARQQELCEAVQAAISLLTGDLRRYLSHAATAQREAGRSVLELLQTELSAERMREQAAIFEEISAVRRESAHRQELIELLEWYL